MNPLFFAMNTEKISTYDNFSMYLNQNVQKIDVNKVS